MITAIKKIYTTYAPDSNTTFIMEDTYSDDGEWISLECIGFYAGEPDQEDTEFYAHKGVKATFK